MREPDWCNMGYHSNGYGAECNQCGTVVELTFGDGEKDLLTVKHRDDVAQEQLFQIMQCWTLLKLERECSCQARYTSDEQTESRVEWGHQHESDAPIAPSWQRFA